MDRAQAQQAIVDSLQNGGGRDYLAATRSSKGGVYNPIMTAQNYQGPTAYGGGGGGTNYYGGGGMGGYSPVNLFPTQLGLQYTDLGSALGGAMGDMWAVNSQNQQAGNEMAMQGQKMELLKSLLGGGGAMGAVGGGTGGVNYGDTQSRQAIGGSFGGGQGQGGGGGGVQAGYYDGNNQWVAPSAGAGGGGGMAGGGMAGGMGGGQARGRVATARWGNTATGTGGALDFNPKQSKTVTSGQLRQAIGGY